MSARTFLTAACSVLLAASAIFARHPTHVARGEDHDVTPLPKLLQRGQTLRGISGPPDTTFRIVVPPGARKLIVETAGGEGDCDLYLRHLAHPTEERHDASSAGSGNDERIVYDDPAPGNWYLLAYAYSAFSGMRVTVDYRLDPESLNVPRLTPGPGLFSEKVAVELHVPHNADAVRYTLDGTEPGPNSPKYRGRIAITGTTTLQARAFRRNGVAGPVTGGVYDIEPPGAVIELQNGVAVRGRAGSLGSETLFKIDVPENRQSLQILTSGGRGDSEILVRHGAEPTSQVHDRRANGRGNRASIRVNTPKPGEWFVLLRGRGPFSSCAVFAQHRSSAPDLIVWGDSLDPYVSEETFLEEDCEVQEGFTEPGARRLLRFTTESRNVGGSDVVLGTPEEHPDWFEFASCHGHYHFKGFAAYRLLDGQGNVAATGRKVSFCLEDVVRWDPLAAEDYLYDCDHQGIQAGWSDIYDSGLPGQWVDITGVAPGDYTLEVTINPDALLTEEDLTNNSATVPVTIE